MPKDPYRADHHTVHGTAKFTTDFVFRSKGRGRCGRRAFRGQGDVSESGLAGLTGRSAYFSSYSFM